MIMIPLHIHQWTRLFFPTMTGCLFSTRLKKLATNLDGIIQRQIVQIPDSWCWSKFGLFDLWQRCPLSSVILASTAAIHPVKPVPSDTDHLTTFSLLWHFEEDFTVSFVVSMAVLRRLLHLSEPPRYLHILSGRHFKHFFLCVWTEWI